MKPAEFKHTDKILIIAPHADDESLGCGGLLLKYGKQCTVVVLTDGSNCGYPDKKEIIKIRLQELENAMNFAQVEKYDNLMIEDQSVSKNLGKLSALSLSKYDYVFVPNENENHIDHSCVLNAVKKILRFSFKTKIVCYEVWTPLVNPDMYLDISDIVGKKSKLISFYESQIKNRDYVNKMLALNSYRGLVLNKDYAEVYTTVKTFIQQFCGLFGVERNDKFILIKVFGLKFKHKRSVHNR